MHVQILVKRQEFEKISGAGRDAVRTSAAFFRVNLRKPVRIHVNRIEGAGTLTVRQSKAAPGAALATTRHDRRGATTFKATVLCYLVCLQAAATATQSSDQFFGSAGINI